MKRRMISILAIVFVLGPQVQLLAGGAQATSHPPTNPKPAVQRRWRPGIWFQPGYPYYWYPQRHYSYRQPVIVLSPYAAYPYSAPATIVASSPFFCLAHQVGYVSRAGMLDHLSGTHKLPLATAVAVCPDENESCIIDGY